MKSLKVNKEQADKMDEDVKTEREDLYKAIAKRGYFKRLLQYNKPYWLIIVGLISSGIQGMTMPVFGYFYVKILFSMFSKDLEEAGMMGMWVIINAIISFT